MDWDIYCYEFKKKAEKAGKSREYCDKWIAYAEKLYCQGLPIIYNQEHLCELVGYHSVYIYAVSNAPEHFYRTYTIPKKSGGTRIISEPLPSLKEIQRWILDHILNEIPVSVYAKAYVQNKSIKDNTKFHRRQAILLSLDVENFFDSLSAEKVYETFKKLGYAEDVVVLLTNLCCLNGCLPQGAPTSPALSNIILFEFDNAIGAFTKEKKIRYTRYADDMSFSGDFQPGEVIRFVKQELRLYNLRINKQKIRTRRKGQRQEVTGIVVNEKMQLSKETRRKIRQEMYYIQKFGLESHQEFCQIRESNYLAHLNGKIQYGLFINPRDQELLSYSKFLREKYREYY